MDSLELDWVFQLQNMSSSPTWYRDTGGMGSQDQRRDEATALSLLQNVSHQLFGSLAAFQDSEQVGKIILLRGAVSSHRPPIDGAGDVGSTSSGNWASAPKGAIHQDVSLRPICLVLDSR